MPTRDIGLRELKKQMTRETIADAALRLALEKGVSEVTIQEISRVAVVSPRTFSNYFSCKEEAVAAAATHDPRTLIENFNDRPRSEAPLQSLSEVLVEYAGSHVPERLQLSVQKLRLEEDSPSMRPFTMAQYEGLEAALRVVIAERTETTLETDVYPWLVAAAAVSVISSSMRIGRRPAPRMVSYPTRPLGHQPDQRRAART